MPLLLDRNDPRAPKYWTYETSGHLARVIARYLEGDTLTLWDVAIFRAYLQQWIDSPVWDGGNIEELRKAAASINSQNALTLWLDVAMESGIDPL